MCRDPSAEGKRIAEHLLSVFGSSDDAFRDASDCLASATLWLHSLKPPAADPGYPPAKRGPGQPSTAGSEHSLGPSQGQSQGQIQGPGQGQGQGQGGAYGGGQGPGQGYELVQTLHYPPQVPPMVGVSGVHQVAMPGVVPAPGAHTVVYHGGVPMPGGAVMVPAPPTPAHHPGQPPATVTRAHRPAGVRFEDYAHRPSDYLKVRRTAIIATGSGFHGLEFGVEGLGQCGSVLPGMLRIRTAAQRLLEGTPGKKEMKGQ